MRNVIFKLMAAACAVFAVSGCKTAQPKYPTRTHPDSPQNWFLPSSPGRPIRRVALLPVWHERYTADVLRNIDIAFNEELAKKAIFEVVPVTRGEMEGLVGRRELSSVEKIPGDLFLRLKEQYGVEGVMLTDITHFSPYRPVAIGVRSKLVDVESGRIHWASDVLYDSSNSAVAVAAKEYQKILGNNGFPIMADGGAVLMSPRMFAQFVAFSNYASLQPPFSTSEPSAGIGAAMRKIF